MAAPTLLLAAAAAPAGENPYGLWAALHIFLLARGFTLLAVLRRRAVTLQ